MKLFYPAFLLLLVSLCTKAQQRQYISNDPAYKYNIDTAYSLINLKKYKQAIPFLEAALHITDKSTYTRNTLATCYYQNRQYDACFDVLCGLCTVEWKQIKSLTARKPGKKENYYKLAKRKRWTELKLCAERGQAQYEARFNPYLRQELKKIKELDQLVRGSVDPSSRNRYPKASWDSLWKTQIVIDSLNMERISQIIDSIGSYPGDSIVGSDLSSVAWIVIQHATLKYQEKYLPLLKNAADNKQLKWSSLALLIDRIEVRHDRPQVYGSQLRTKPGSTGYILMPILDEKNVNQRRAQVGLEPLEIYLQSFGLEWKPPVE